MTTLITGGFGFIGAHVVKEFTAAGESVVVTSYENLEPPTFLSQEVKNGLLIKQCDIGDPGVIQQLAQEYKIDTIINLAIHRKSSTDPAEDLRINMDKLSHFFDGALKGGVERLFWASNGAIFAELPQGPFYEDTAVSLSGAIQPGAFKKAWEVLAHNFAQNYQISSSLKVVSMRISGVFGPTYRSMLNLPSRLCHAASKNLPPDFSAQRGGVPYSNDIFDLTYVKDVAAAVLALYKTDNLPHSVYNVSRGKAVEATELVDAVKKYKTTFNVELQEGTGPRFRPNAYLDNSRIFKDTQWSPRFSIETATEDYLDWLDSGEIY